MEEVNTQTRTNPIVENSRRKYTQVQHINYHSRDDLIDPVRNKMCQSNIAKEQPLLLHLGMPVFLRFNSQNKVQPKEKSMTAPIDDQTTKLA